MGYTPPGGDIAEPNKSDSNQSNGISNPLASVPQPLRGSAGLGSDDSIVLLEKVHGRVVSRFLRIARLFAFILIGVVIISILIGYLFLLPYFAKTLPSYIRSPQNTFPSYQRTIRGTLDYYPVTRESGSKSLAEFANGGSFSFETSADIISGSGYQGYVKIGLDATDGSDTTSDIAVDYVLHWPTDQSVDAYLRFVRWPQSMEMLIPQSLAGSTWLHYDSTKSKASHTTLTQAFLFFNTRTFDKDQRRFVSLFWKYGVATKALKPHIDKVFRYDERKKMMVMDVSIEVHPEFMKELVAAMKADPEYRSIQAMVETGDNGLSILDMITSLNSASVTLTIGIGDRTIKSMHVVYDEYNQRFGTLRGAFTTEIMQRNTQAVIVKPKTSEDMSGLLEMIAILNATSTPTSTSSLEPAALLDSDADGLTDDQERKFGTDPNNPDSDKDGYTDGDEVRNNYNPLGAGTLK